MHNNMNFTNNIKQKHTKKYKIYELPCIKIKIKKIKLWYQKLRD